MKLPKWWRVHFLRVEMFLSILLTLIFVAVSEYGLMPQEIVSALSGSRSALYATLASIFGSLLGFSITAASVVVTIKDAPRLRIVRESRHHTTLWSVFFSTIRTVGMATVIALAGLLFDQVTSPKPWLFYLMLFAFIHSCLRITRTVWVLEHVVSLASSGNSESASQG